MKDIILRQDNRITTARYELSLVEKNVMYVIIKQIRKQFVINDDGQKDLFDDLVVKMNSSQLLKDLHETNSSRIKQGLKNLRLRSFEYHNGKPEEDKNHEWLEVGFINYSKWKPGGEIEVQVSKEILPFFVELTRNFTEYSLVVAISLKSKWSQRLYELSSKWKAAGGFRMSITELRELFDLKEKYSKYAAFKKFVLDVGHKELKTLFKKGESDLYFEYTEEKVGRTIENIRFKIISNSKEIEPSLDDLDYLVRTQLHDIFETKKKERNKEFVTATMSILRLDVEKLKHCYKKLLSIKDLPKDEKGRYMRFVILEDYIDNKKA